jgi:hypothetical protein
MQSLREICNQYTKWKPIEDYILRIEGYSETDGISVLENCKAMVESICKTILHDLGEECGTADSIQSLVSKACNKMKCLPNTGDLARSFITVAQRLGEFRNAFGTVGHGQSVYQLEESKKKVIGASVAFMISTVEQLAIFLITVYQEEYPQHIQRNLRYEDNTELNAALDEGADPVQIGAYGPYKPSEVLFYIDEDAYKTELSSRTQ